MDNTLAEIIFQLQYNPHALIPDNWLVSINQAPKKYKVYTNVKEAINLPLDTHLISGNKLNPQLKEIQILSYFLGYSYGLTSLNLQLPFSQSTPQNPSLIQFMRRGVASGGGLYPNQIYLYIRDIDGILPGVYYYDLIHHRLVLLRLGNYDPYLVKIIDPTLQLTHAHFLVFITVAFWKNFFKYSNFGYRLTGLDTGFLIGQFLNLAEQFNFLSKISYYFQDLSLNKLIGVDSLKESSYATLSFMIRDANNKVRQTYIEQQEMLHEVINTPINTITVDQDESLELFPYVKQLHQNSLITSSSSLLKYLSYEFDQNIHDHNSKDFDYNIFLAINNRISPGKYFVNASVQKQTLANIINTVSPLLDKQSNNRLISANISLYVYINNVTGVERGIYYCNIERKELQLISAGDYAQYLNDNLTYKNFDFNHIALCFHLAANNNFLMNFLGYRGYRITQMLTGIIAQKLQLFSTYWGLGCHPIMSYNTAAIDELYGLPTKGLTTLIQMAVGPFQPPPRLKSPIIS